MLKPLLTARNQAARDIVPGAVFMRRESACVAAISSLATLLLGCASTSTILPAAHAPAKPATASAANSKGPGGAATAPITSTNLEEQIQAATALRLHGDAAQATRALAQLVLVAPDDPRVLGEYGKALVQQGRAEDAVAFLKGALQVKANDWTLYSALGVAYDQMDDRKDAKVAYDRALLLHPGDPTVLNNYAVSRMLAKDFDNAQRLLMQAQAAGGNLPKIAGNLQLLAQLRATKTPPGAKSTTAASESPSPAVSTHAPFRASGPKTAPAVVVMQQVPSDTTSATSQHIPKPDLQIGATVPSVSNNPVPRNRAADATPRTITPELGERKEIVSTPLAQSENTMPASIRASSKGSSAGKSRSSAKSGRSTVPAKPAVTAQKAQLPPVLRTAD
jgi:Flp pilus assembly protein TadD